MGANEAVALEANFESWKSKRFPILPNDINVFEYYCAEQFLRTFDLSDSEMKSGLIGGSKDGGVDALYMLVNGEVVDAESELDPKTPNTVKVLVMQMKEGQGFSPLDVDKLYWFTDDLLDLNRKKADYHTQYRPELIGKMLLFKDKYRVIVGENPPLSVEFYYITKKDVSPNQDCIKSADKVKATVKKHFSHAQCDFHFADAAALWKQVQTRPPKKKTLKWAAQSLSTPEGQIGLVRLADYYEFLREANGQIAERFFDSNVRGYWKSTRVNQRIAATLKSPKSPEFWLLNNGVTILAEKIDTGEHLEVELTDPQIVNGLQTSREIYNYYSNSPSSYVGSPPTPLPDERRVLLRIIKTTDTTIRDAVIRCTNSQNEMPEESLRTTDPIHRQIETLFDRFSLFYDRRKGHYREQGKPVAQVVSVVEVLQAMLSVVLGRPDDARGRPRDYFKKDDLYALVFGKDKYDLNLYLRSTQTARIVGDFLDTLGLEAVHRRNINFYLCMYAVCVKAGSPHAAPGRILALDQKSLSPEFLQECYDRVAKLYHKLAEKLSVDGEKDYDSLAKGPQLLKAINADLKKRFAGKGKQGK